MGPNTLDVSTRAAFLGFAILYIIPAIQWVSFVLLVSFLCVPVLACANLSRLD